MHELNIKLTRAGLHDLALVSSLASQIWKEHYTPIIGKAQVDYMLKEMYSAEGLNDQVKNKNHIFYLIQTGVQTVGFISVSAEKENKWFLNKFYILDDMAGKGLGTKAFEELKKIIAPKKMTLTVNRQNYKSINFYFKNHFKIDHVADFDIGHGYVMNDFVMVWEKVAG
ncbi:MAG: GNAT family N-acetyltransferase [Bacteroidota bacterium]